MTQSLCLLRKWRTSSILCAWLSLAIMNADTMISDGIQARLDKLQKELIRKANSRQDSDAKADETFLLRRQKSQAEADTRSSEKTQKRIAGQETDITKFDEALVKKSHREDHRLCQPLRRGIQVRHHTRYRGIK